MSDKVDVLSEDRAKKLMLSYEACFRSVNSECLVIFPDAFEGSSFLGFRDIMRKFCNLNCCLLD